MKTVQISFCIWGVKIKANLRIKKEKNNTILFSYQPWLWHQRRKIQKYLSGFSTQKEARKKYSKFLLMDLEELNETKNKMMLEYYVNEVFFLGTKDMWITDLRKSTPFSPQAFLVLLQKSNLWYWTNKYTKLATKNDKKFKTILCDSGSRIVLSCHGQSDCAWDCHNEPVQNYWKCEKGEIENLNFIQKDNLRKWFLWSTKKIIIKIFYLALISTHD